MHVLMSFMRNSGYIKTTNLLAVLTESYVLRALSSNSVDMQHVLKEAGGGTECFSHDCLGSLEAIFNEAEAHQSEILKSFGL